MKITLIHGQNHLGSSCHIGRILAEKLSAPEERTEFFLPRDLNHFCCGCCRCIDQEEACPFYENKRVILDAMEAADLLIFTTPTYCMHASAPMKSFLDLTFTSWMVHRPRKAMFSKKAIVISTAAGCGTQSAIKDIKTALTYWGIPEIYSLGFSVQAMGWDQVAESKKAEIKKKIQKLTSRLSANGRPAVPFKTKFLFEIMRKMQISGMGSSPAEKQYWYEMGWLGRSRPWKNAQQETRP